MAWWRLWEAPYVCGLLLAGLLLRLALTPYGVYAGDAQMFRVWALRLASSPLASFYVERGQPGGFREFGTPDHLPGDMWLLWLVAQLYQRISPHMAVESFGFLFLLKLVAILGDVGIGLLLYLCARPLGGARAGLLAAGAFLLNPAAIFLSATWGQWDAVSAMVMLLALWLVLRSNPAWALPPLTYACLIKPQLVVLLPLLLAAWWRWRMQPAGSAGRPAWREIGTLGLAVLAALAVFLAVDLPFGVGLPGMGTRWTIFERGKLALNRFPEASVNAFNLWGLLLHDDLYGDDRRAGLAGLSYQHWGMLLLAIALVAIVALFWRRPTPEMAVWAGLAATLALFVLSTRMHERYLMPALVLAILFAALVPRAWWIATLLSATYFINLVVVYRMDFGLPARPSPDVVVGVSAVNLTLFLAVLGVGVAMARQQLSDAGEGDAWSRTARPRVGAIKLAESAQQAPS